MIESPFLISKNPFVGPLPIVVGLVSKIPSPSTSCKKPVRIISPEKIPELEKFLSIYMVLKNFHQMKF